MSVAVTDGTHGSMRSRNRLDIAALWYLALPNLIFVATWVKPVFGFPAALLLAGALVSMSRKSYRPASSASLAVWGISIGTALVWLVLSGIGHFVYANTDWAVRDVVLNDLSTRPWPVEYTIRGDDLPLLLRAPIGYFLTAAAAARAVGVETEHMLLFGWTMIGVVISFLLLAGTQKRASVVSLLIFVFIFFSGLDIIGYLIFDESPTLGKHLEWWALLFQYSSITTQMFWVPNHALPAWIVTLWLLRHDNWRSVSPQWLIVLIALTPLWSPLAAIGLAGLGATVILGRLVVNRGAGWYRTWIKELLDPAVLITAAVSLLLIAPYLVIAGETVPGSWITEGRVLSRLFEIVAIFVLIEFGIYWILMWRRYRFDLLLTTAGVSLLLLPWYRFGPYADLTMRASIPALVVFAVRLGDWFAERLIRDKDQPANEDTIASLAMLAFIIGMATPFQELVRPFLVPVRAVDTSASLYGTVAGNATHYLSQRIGRYAEDVLAPGHPPPQSEGEISAASKKPSP